MKPCQTFAICLLVLLTNAALATVYYVDITSLTSTPPYTNWTTAATNIQDAVDAASAGDKILVNDGVYRNGGRAIYGWITNRLAVTKPLTVESVNGPQATVIQGDSVSGVRCVYLTNDAMLIGFMLTNGFAEGDNYDNTNGGGGAWCESSSAVLSNCVLTGNSTGWVGGGAFGGTLNSCVLSNNSARYGGGAFESVLNNSIMRGNFITSGNGSAVYGGTLSNCIVAGSSASEGYTTSFSRLNNCTIVQNRNGADECTLNNCILYYSGENYGSNTFNHCCTTPMPTNGFGNITNEPLFLDLNAGNLRLHSNSPCINSGKNTYAPAGPDLDGNPRIVGGTVDIGAYEFQNPASMISYAWLQLYGFPTDVSADLQDTDSDGMNNFQEWIAGTNPTNALSVLMMLAPSNSVSGIAVSWQSVSGITYFLQHGTNLGVQPAFASVQSNLVGQAGVTAFTDTNAIGQGPFFYRVGVQQ